MVGSSRDRLPHAEQGLDFGADPEKRKQQNDQTYMAERSE
jgi:hypothetical protein